MKKIVNYLIAIAIVLVQFVSVANAATIKINDAVDGQVYNAYKIFDVTKAGENYAYSIDSDNDWFSVVSAYATDKGTITLTKVGNTKKYVVQVNGLDAVDFAAYLNDNKALKNITASVTADLENNTETVIDGLAAGYYFVDSSLGALCILNTATDVLDIYEKNGVPTVDKTVSQSSAAVGDTVKFTVKITAGGKADTSYILHDKMTEGLTLNADSFTVVVDGKAVDASNYTITTENLDDDCTFEIVFNQAYTATLDRNTVIIVEYTATVNEKAIVNSVDTNEAKVQYGNTYSPSSTKEVKNYEFNLIKVDEERKTLDGAQFKLYDAATGGNEILLKKVTENGETFYRPIKDGETADAYIEAGTVSIRGLEFGTYYLEEIKAPEGYNQLVARQIVNLNEDITVSNEVTVVNTTGSMLPHTGGMGTMVFIIIGSIMVLGFGVILVTKLRVSKMYI